MMATRLRQILEGPILLAGDPLPEWIGRSEHPHAELACGTDTRRSSPGPLEEENAPLRDSIPDLGHE